MFAFIPFKRLPSAASGRPLSLIEPGVVGYLNGGKYSLYFPYPWTISICLYVNDLHYLCSVENGTQLGFLEDYGYSNPDELSTSAPERAVYDFRQVFPGFIEKEVVQLYPDQKEKIDVHKNLGVSTNNVIRLHYVSLL